MRMVIRYTRKMIVYSSFAPLFGANPPQMASNKIFKGKIMTLLRLTGTTYDTLELGTAAVSIGAVGLLFTVNVVFKTDVPSLNPFHKYFAFKNFIRRVLGAHLL